eukprot:scaffold5793_cov146-Skeletonema_menzelii.AAC.2
MLFLLHCRAVQIPVQPEYTVGTQHSAECSTQAPQKPKYRQLVGTSVLVNCTVWVQNRHSTYYASLCQEQVKILPLSFLNPTTPDARIGFVKGISSNILGRV